MAWGASPGAPARASAGQPAATVSVLHVVTSTQRRGAETAALALADGLTRFGVAGEVVALSERADRGLPVEVLGRTSRGPSTLRVLRRRARAHQVVVAHGSDTLLACATALADSAPRFVYLAVGDPRRWARGPRRVVNAVALRRAARVAVLGDAAADAVSAWYRIPEQRMAVLPNFRSSRRFRPPAAGERAAAVAALGLDPGAPVVAVIGALSAEKRAEVAVGAALRVPGVQVVVAGDGPRLEAVRRAATADPARVRLLGSVPDASPLLRGSDAVVLASTTEGVPGVLVEAGLSGVPAVTTDVGWVRDVVQDGVTGRVAAGDGVAALGAALADVLARREVYGRQALEWCRARFSEEVVLPLWERVLRAVVAEEAA